MPRKTKTDGPQIVQTVLDGCGPPNIPSLDAAVEAYLEAKAARIAAEKKEAKMRHYLHIHMKRLGDFKVYRTASDRIVRLVTEEDVTVQ